MSRLQTAEWALGGVTLATALGVWWQVRQPLESSLTLYEVFPLLGLIAFGLMWTHVVMGAIRRYHRLSERSTAYRDVSMTIVLACIIAHPALVWLALARDGFGLPPLSQYAAFGGTAMLNAALFAGVVALTIFLAYELKRWFGERSWWPWIEWLQVPAMLLIIYHGLTLGGELAVSWYQAIWWLYAITLVAAGMYTIYDVNKQRGEAT